MRGTWEAIGRLRDDSENFVVVGQPEAISEQIVGLGRQAYQAAVAMDVSPYPFMMMVAVGVVTGILPPIAGAPMLIVMNPGSYEFQDYAKVGFPLLILIFIVNLILVPMIWPLY